MRVTGRHAASVRRGDDMSGTIVPDNDPIAQAGEWRPPRGWCTILRVVRSLDTASCEPAQTGAPRRWICRLTIVHPPQLRASFEPDERATTLGRELDGPGDIVVSHSTVSRRHAELRWDPVAGRHFVRDLGSRNGTLLHGQPLGPVPRLVDDNAVLRLGDVLLVYERIRAPFADSPRVDRDAVPGEALAIAALRDALARAAPDPSPVLLIGESGTGKERAAAEIHRLSGRRGPLLSLNCAALSAQLIESQLFGHQRGAFTGATQSQPGLLRAAEGGSLFLDELGELALDLQPKLLRAIEEGEILPVGTTAPQRVDVRVIAATNRVLADEVEAGRFRGDLHARLALWELELPPLTRRRVDLLTWLDRLAATWAAERGAATPDLACSPDAAAAILLHRWPSNLRGLQRLVHALAHRNERAPLRVDDLPTWLIEHVPGDRQNMTAPPEPASPRELRPRPTREELLAVLLAHDWNINAVARVYARDRKQVSRWIAMYEIVVPERDSAAR